MFPHDWIQITHFVSEIPQRYASVVFSASCQETHKCVSLTSHGNFHHVMNVLSAGSTPVRSICSLIVDQNSSRNFMAFFFFSTEGMVVLSELYIWFI